MVKEYYSLLELTRSATSEDIAKAYRRLALRYHPLKNPADVATNSFKFSEISEAYDVLHDAARKSIYDQYGEDALKEGLPDGKGGLRGGYKFSGNAFEVFEKFFGSTNPFFEIYDESGKDLYGTLFGSAYGGLGFEKPVDLKDLEVVIDCNLQELYNGCMKKITFDRSVLNLDGKTTRVVRESKEIEIKPGYGKNTQLKYAHQGHEVYGHPTTNLIAKIKENTFGSYKRRGNDLIYTQHISLLNAINSDPVQIKTLDGRLLSIALDEIICPKTVKQVKGEGMPIYNDDPLAALKLDHSKGDLYIKFDIAFPKHLSEEQKEQLREILSNE